MEIIYNPEGSLLRHDQLELLRMLKIVDKICKENDITWWLSSGTLLGAARHQGFIPWDDDMDIVMLKKDYKKLERVLLSMDSDEFVFHCCKSDVDYVNTFGKFRHKQGRIQSANKRYDYYKWAGIGFDIFAIEKTNYLAARLSQISYNRLQSLTYNIKNHHIRRLLIRGIEFLQFYIINPILRILGSVNPKQEYHYVLGTGWPSHTFYMKDTFPLSQAKFEDSLFPVPKDYDSYLTNVYGNWRAVPSEREIMDSIHCLDYKNEIIKR